MTNTYPHELSLGDVYFSPLLAVLFMAFIGALVTVMILKGTSKNTLPIPKSEPKVIIPQMMPSFI